MPQRSSDPYKDYFKEVREGIDSRVLLDEAKKTAEEAAIGSMGDLPSLGPNSMFMSYSDPYKQMATYLRDNKDEMLKTEEGRRQYQSLMDSAMQFGVDGKAQTAYINPLLQRNMKISKSGVNPKEWELQGMEDSHSFDEYKEYTAAIDTARYQVTEKDGQWVLSDGTRQYQSNDDSLFSRKFFEDHLTITPEKPPTQWWSLNHQDSKYANESEAVSWVGATVANNSRYTLDAVRWSEKNGVFPDGMTADEAMMSDGRVEEAVEAYSRAAVPKGWKKEKKGSSTDKGGGGKGKTEDSRKVSYEDIIKASSEKFVMPNESNTDLEIVDDIAYYPLGTELNISAATWKGFGEEEDDGSEFKTKRKKFSLNAVYMTSEDGLFAVDSAGNLIPVRRGQIEYTSLSNQFDEAYGEGEFEKLVSELYSDAHESDDRIVNERKWKEDQGLIKAEEQIEEERKIEEERRQAELTQMELDRASSYPTGGMR